MADLIDVKPDGNEARKLETVYHDLETLNHLIAEVIATTRVPGAGDYRVADEMAASVRFGLGMMVDDLDRMRRKQEQQNRLNRCRAEMWRIATDKKLSEMELIHKLIVITGESLEVSRVSYAVPEDGIYRCVEEWRAPGVSSSVGVALPGKVVRYMARDDFNVISPETIGEYLPETMMRLFGALLDRLAADLHIGSLAFIPVRIRDGFEGVVGMDVCGENAREYPWTDERRALALELVRIIARSLHQRRMEQAVMASRDELEVRVRERTADLEEANRKLAEHLQEKEVLLKEIHHRVKNNLQTVSSLLSLQARQSNIPGTEGMFRDCQTRIRAISLLHEKLYKSDDLAHIDFAPYVERIVNDLYYMYADTAGHVARQVDIKKVWMGVDKAIPCGLIINELVSNAFKYAFPGDRTGTVRVAMELYGTNHCRLEVSDSGIGLPGEIENTEGLGMELVRTLVMQLEGEMDTARNSGTSFTIRFLC